MRYAELERAIKLTTNCLFWKNGSNHPLWINPGTGEVFAMSHHRNEEVKAGTLKGIIKKSGAKI